METCETPRPPNKSDNQSSYRTGGKYGFIDRVLDGIYVRINSVLVKLVSKTFQASVELSRLTVQSMTPRWKPSDNLRETRVKDSERDAVILFKEIEWQNTRINASSVDIGTTDFSSPLRLIANQAKIRLTMKKQLADSSIIATRLELHLDDLLWVLTKSQLREAILYANSLSKIIESSAEQSKQRAAEKLQQQVYHSYVAEQPKSPSHPPQTAHRTDTQAYDVKTTSYHLFINPINLHLCDDSSNETVGGKERLWNIEGGSMQITMYKLCVDFYPFHSAGSDREQWHNYETIGSRQEWVKKLFDEFRRDAVNIRSIVGNSPNTPRPANSKASMQDTGQKQSPSKKRSTRLLESCCVVKIKDIAVYMVSTSSTKQCTLHKFLASDKQVPLPSDTCTSVVHIQFTNYFFPEEMQYPVPDANMYMVLRPIRITVDYTTLLWANYFFMDLSQNVDMDLIESEAPSEHIDIKVEAIMPRIIVPSDTKVEGQPVRPEYVQLVVSQLTATNIRIDDRSSRTTLQNLLQKYEKGDLFFTDSFPNGNQSYQIIPKPLKQHAENEDNPYINNDVKFILQNIDAGSCHSNNKIDLHSNTLKKKAECDVWCLVMDSVCLDFLGIHNHKSRPVPFVEAFPLTVWLSGKSKSDKRKSASVSKKHGAIVNLEEKESRPSKLKLKQYYSFDYEDGATNCDNNQLADNHVIAEIGAKISLQINHYQYLFLLRLTESFTRFQSQLNSDLLLFMNSEPSTFCIPLLVPVVEVAVVCPFLSHLQTFPDFGSPVHVFAKDANIYSPEHRKIKVMGHKKQASNSAPNRISVNTADSMSSLEDNPNIITKSMSDSTIHVMPTDTCEFTTDTVAVTIDTCDHRDFDTVSFNSLQRKASSTTSIPNEVQHPELHVTNSFGGDSGVFIDNPQIAKYSNQVKIAGKAFSVFLNDKFKFRPDDDSLSVCDDDAVSISTDVSDDDFIQLSIIDDNDSPVFQTDKHSETASVTDTYSDDGSSVYADSVTTKSKEMISVTVFKLDKGEVILYGNDRLSTTAAQISSIMTCCHGNTTCEELHNKLAGKGFFADEKENEEDSLSNFPIKLKYMIESRAPGGNGSSSPVHKADTDNTCIKLQVKGVALELNMSSITSLTEFIEDEQLPEIIPISIEVSDLLLILCEDRPSVNIGAPSPPPQNIHINQLLIEKGLDGIFNIKALSTEPLLNGSNVSSIASSMESSAVVNSDLSSFKSSMILLQAENYKLVQKLTEMNKVRKENDFLQTKLSLTTSELEKLRNGNISLVDRIKTLNNIIPNLPNDQIEKENVYLHDKVLQMEENLESTNKDNETLQKTLKFLQNELLAAEKRYQNKFADRSPYNQM